MEQETSGIEEHANQEFTQKKAKFFGNFAIEHRPEMKKLIEGRILGPESDGWRNISEHNLLAGVVADKIGDLFGLSQEDQQDLVSVATTHDWDKRLDKEAVQKAASVDASGQVIVQADAKAEMAKEDAKSGLVRVTGGNWDDFDTWGPKEKILRYVDSSLGSTKDGHADLVSWKQRIEDLKVRYKEAQDETDRFTHLGEITEDIEAQLYDRITSLHPELKHQYPEKNQLTTLIKDKITSDIYQVSPSKQKVPVAV